MTKRRHTPSIVRLAIAAVLALSIALYAQEKAIISGRLSSAYSPETQEEREGFLLKATVVTMGPADGRPSWRATLDDGLRRHDAAVNTENGSGPTRRNYRLNLAAYQLDKLLGLNLVPA
jgi:hypothetical protein